jgi:hypothetical protein
MHSALGSEQRESERSIGYIDFVLPILGVGVGFCRVTIGRSEIKCSLHRVPEFSVPRRNWTSPPPPQQASVSPPTWVLASFQRLSVDYSQLHSHNFSNFQRRLAFTQASTFLYGLEE